jgi:hypothetical protein
MTDTNPASVCKTYIIECGRHRVLIGEHVDRAYVASSVDGASMGGFLSAKECLDVAAVLMMVARHINQRAKAAKTSPDTHR